MTRQDRGAAKNAAEARAYENRREAMAWAAEHISESVERGYQAFAADAYLWNRWQGYPLSVQAVKRTISTRWPWLVERIKRERKEEG